MGLTNGQVPDFGHVKEAQGIEGLEVRALSLPTRWSC